MTRHVIETNSTIEDHNTLCSLFATEFCHFAQRDGVWERIQYCVGVAHGVDKGFQLRLRQTGRRPCATDIDRTLPDLEMILIRQRMLRQVCDLQVRHLIQ